MPFDEDDFRDTVRARQRSIPRVTAVSGTCINTHALAALSEVLNLQAKDETTWTSLGGAALKIKFTGEPSLEVQIRRELVTAASCAAHRAPPPLLPLAPPSPPPPPPHPSVRAYR